MFQAFAALFELRTGGDFGGDGVVAGGLDASELIAEHVLDEIGASVQFAQDVNGKPNFAAGARTTARDWARFGRLILDDGRWAGRRVLAPASVRRCMHYRTPAYLGYGLSFWLNRPVEDSFQPELDDLPGGVSSAIPLFGRMMPSAPPDYYAAWGAGNMQLHLIPSERLVIVKFGGTGEQNSFFQALFAD